MKKNYLLSGIAFLVLMLCGTSSLFAASWHYPTKRPMEVIFEDGLGTKESPYVIKSAQQLADLSWMVNDGTTYEGQYFVLGNDIDLNPGFTFGKDGNVKGEGTPQQWVPIGATGVFKGNLDGKGHTIKGMYITSGKIYSHCIYVGLLGQIANEYVKNLNIQNSVIDITQNSNRANDGTSSPDDLYGIKCGAIAAVAIGTSFVNCTNDMNIHLKSDVGAYIGGIVGEQSSSKSVSMILVNCINKGNLQYELSDKDNYSMENFIGGIVGSCEGFSAIKGCSNYGDVVNGKYGAGIVGYASGSYIGETEVKAESLANYGNIVSSISYKSGGLFGVVGGVKQFTNCINEGTLDFRTETYMGPWAGALAGDLGGCDLIENFINRGDVYAGCGLATSASVKHINKCANFGNITNGSGLITELLDLEVMENSCNVGNVVGKNTYRDEAGGLVGCGASWGNTKTWIIRNCYNFGSSTMGAIIGDWDSYLKVENCYYLDSSVTNKQSYGVAMSASDFASGKVCVLLNEGQDPMPWGQTVGTDPYPLLNGKGNPETGIVPVIYSGKSKNAGIYDLDGRKVNAPVAKGIYIKDGKKMVLGK